MPALPAIPEAGAATVEDEAVTEVAHGAQPDTPASEGTSLPSAPPAPLTPPAALTAAPIPLPALAPHEPTAPPEPTALPPPKPTAPLEPTEIAASLRELATGPARPIIDAAASAPAALTPTGDDQPTTATRAAGAPPTGGCTPSQIRRFIRSRPYIPLHELRRRFGINGAEDEMATVTVDGRNLFVGLPEREGRMLGELLRNREVGYELSHDPVTPVIVGVFPTRPVQRP